MLGCRGLLFIGGIVRVGGGVIGPVSVFDVSYVYSPARSSAGCAKFPLQMSHRAGLLDGSDEVFRLLLLPPSSPPAVGLTLVLVRGSVPFFQFNSCTRRSKLKRCSRRRPYVWTRRMGCPLALCLRCRQIVRVSLLWTVRCCMYRWCTFFVLPVFIQDRRWFKRAHSGTYQSAALPARASRPGEPRC